MPSRMTPAAVDRELKRLRRARYESYLRDGVEWVRWISIDDGQRCAICASMHGRILAMDDATWPKLLHIHSGCRCRFILLHDKEIELMRLRR